MGGEQEGPGQRPSLGRSCRSHRTLHTAHPPVWLCLGDSLSLILPICHLGTIPLPFRIRDHTERPPAPGTAEAGEDRPLRAVSVGSICAPCWGFLALCVMVLGLTVDPWSLESIFTCEKSHSSFVLPTRGEREMTAWVGIHCGQMETQA